jgi:hypothetical protein
MCALATALGCALAARLAIQRGLKIWCFDTKLSLYGDIEFVQPSRREPIAQLLCVVPHRERTVSRRRILHQMGTDLYALTSYRNRGCSIFFRLFSCDSRAASKLRL